MLIESEADIRRASRIETKRNCATRLLFMGYEISKVAEITDLTEEYVKAIKRYYDSHDYDPDKAPLTMVPLERIEAPRPQLMKRPADEENMTLTQYTPEQLIEIIQNIAPNGIIDWAEDLDKDLTDPKILAQYRFHMDGLRDYFTEHREELAVLLNGLKEKCSKEETIQKMMDCFDLNHYEAKLYVERNWES